MATPAWRFEVEKTVEQRLERLEVHVEHIQSDVSELKVDFRRLNDKIDALDEKLTGKIDALDEKLTGKIDALDEKLTGKIDALDHKVTGKIDGLAQAIADLKVGRALDRVWWLLLSAALLGVMARGFKWI
jgi:chromosome segregation ATPase